MSRTSMGGVLLKAFLPVLAYSAGAAFKIFPNIELQTIALWGLFIFVVAGAVEYLTVVYPARRWESIAPFIADQVTNDFFDFIRKRVKIEPRMNVMMPVRYARYFWFYRTFIFWWSRGMDNQRDVGMAIPDGWGVVNECFKRKEPIFANPKILEQKHNLPSDSQALVSDLDVLISVPIYEPRNGSRPQSGHLLGILNLDSKTLGAFEVLKNDPALLLQVKRKMEKIAILLGHMI